MTSNGRSEETFGDSTKARKVATEASAGSKIYLEALISSFRLYMGDIPRGQRKNNETPTGAHGGAEVRAKMFPLSTPRGRKSATIERSIKVSPGRVEVAKYFGIVAP